MHFICDSYKHFQINKAIINGTRGGRKTKFFMNHRIACNKDLNAKGKAVELTVSVNGKFVIT